MTLGSQRNILMTTALPYANGPLHLGHMVEHIQADIWARWQRLRGNNCLFLCGDDAHGTPIMLSAEKQNTTPEALIAHSYAEHYQDFQDFLISFDHYHTTHSPENRELVELIYRRLVERGDITKRTIVQAFDPIKKIFLPDRFVRGECPRCGCNDQYGDNCEVCGATYSPTDLINPVSAISGATPVQKETEHFFFTLHKYQELLDEWLDHGRLQPQVVNKLREWFTGTLHDWDISRDAPYFGFEIPDHPGKFFYVWLDAPVGYMACLQSLAQQRDDIHFDDYWQPNQKTELYHFIGKDIIYFHALFWPAMLHGAGFRMPSGVFVHGYLTINGAKMSKSRGTFITARHYLQQSNPEYLRYYYAAKLSAQVEDIDLNIEDFAQRVNSDVVGKYVNLASRSAGFINKKFSGQLAKQLHDETLFKTFVTASQDIADCYEVLNYNKAVRLIMALADQANQYVDFHKPWVLAKTEDGLEQVQLVCTQALNLFRLITLYLKPILPATADRVEDFLNIEPLVWSDRSVPLLDHTIKRFQPLMTRITPDMMAGLSAS